MHFLSSIRDWLLDTPEPTGPFTPTYADVCRARALLKTLKLPTELALSILDYAQYWPIAEFSQTSSKVRAIASGSRPAAASLCLEANIYAEPIVEVARCHGETAKVKRIEFEIRSRDQGWTSENTQGTFATSSWLEVSILRNTSSSKLHHSIPLWENTWIGSPKDYHDHIVATASSACDVEEGWSLVKRPESALQGPQGGEGDYAWYLQGNRVMAGSQYYYIVWDECGLSEGNEGNEGAGSGNGFLDALRPGDWVLVWARAKYPGWQCIVEEANVTVHYGF